MSFRQTYCFICPCRVKLFMFWFAVKSEIPVFIYVSSLLRREREDSKWLNMFSRTSCWAHSHALFVFPSECKGGNGCVNSSSALRPALTVGEGEDGVDAKIQPWQALQGGQLVLRVLSGGGPATAHHTGGVNPAVTLDAAAPRGLPGGQTRAVANHSQPSCDY